MLCALKEEEEKEKRCISRTLNKSGCYVPLRRSSACLLLPTCLTEVLLPPSSLVIVMRFLMHVVPILLVLLPQLLFCRLRQQVELVTDALKKAPTADPFLFAAYSSIHILF